MLVSGFIRTVTNEKKKKNLQHLLVNKPDGTTFTRNSFYIIDDMCRCVQH